MLKKHQLKDYQDWAKIVEAELDANTAWIDQYNNYAKDMLKNEEKFREARKLFKQWANLRYYLTIGNAKDGVKTFDIRYLGQSVGNLKIKKNKDKQWIVSLIVDETKTKNNFDCFDYPLGEIKDAVWNEKNGKAKEFRKFFKGDVNDSKLPRQKEHMVESALYSEMEKTNSDNKTLCGIQPVKFANTRIHMKTSLAASKSLKDIVEQTKTGGEIDLLCRRKCDATNARLVAIEIKDQNETTESFDMAIKQAVAYSVFLVKLLRKSGTKTRENWLKIFGMQNQYKDKIVIEAAVAMPEGKTAPSYGGEIIKLASDEIVLHYIKINNYVPGELIKDDVIFEHSFKGLCYKKKAVKDTTAKH